VESKKETKNRKDKLEFNTYCIFTEEKKNIEETIGLVFKDYLESIKIKKNNKNVCKVKLSTL